MTCAEQSIGETNTSKLMYLYMNIDYPNDSLSSHQIAP